MTAQHGVLQVSQAGDFWQYAMFATIACLRAAADRADVPSSQVCQQLTERPAARPT